MKNSLWPSFRIPNYSRLIKGSEYLLVSFSFFKIAGLIYITKHHLTLFCRSIIKGSVLPKMKVFNLKNKNEHILINLSGFCLSIERTNKLKRLERCCKNNPYADLMCVDCLDVNKDKTNFIFK